MHVAPHWLAPHPYYDSIPALTPIRLVFRAFSTTSKTFFSLLPPPSEMRNTLIFTGNSCPALTGKICENLGMAPAAAELSQFSNVSTPCPLDPANVAAPPSVFVERGAVKQGLVLVRDGSEMAEDAIEEE